MVIVPLIPDVAQCSGGGFIKGGEHPPALVAIDPTPEYCINVHGHSDFLHGIGAL